MGFNNWMALESAMHGEEPRRKVSRETLRRILEFARPHRRALIGFLLLSVVTAGLTVATPVLAGRVVEAIINGGDEGRIIGLALLIAFLGLVDAGVGIIERRQSSKIGEGQILALRRAGFGHVQRMPVAFFMRTRTGALISRLDNDVCDAGPPAHGSTPPPPLWPAPGSTPGRRWSASSGSSRSSTSSRTSPSGPTP